MRVEFLTVPPLENNIYLLVDEQSGEAAAVDTASGGRVLLRRAEEVGAHITLIVNTHGHEDHISDNDLVKKATGAKLAIHELDSPMLSSDHGGSTIFSMPAHEPSTPDILLHEGDRLSIGSMTMHVLHTPGHTPGSISLYMKSEDMLFTGDTLFNGSCGRVDLPGGDPQTMLKSLSRLCGLPPSTKVYPGHGSPTTIVRELAWIRSLTAHDLTC